MGRKAGYKKGYEDNIFRHHACDTPKKAGETVSCHRYPVYLGRNQNGLPSVKIMISQDVFDRWISARDDEKEPATSIDCTVNALGEVGDCTFPAG